MSEKSHSSCIKKLDYGENNWNTDIHKPKIVACDWWRLRKIAFILHHKTGERNRRTWVFINPKTFDYNFVRLWKLTFLLHRKTGQNIKCKKDIRKRTDIRSRFLTSLKTCIRLASENSTKKKINNKTSFINPETFDHSFLTSLKPHLPLALENRIRQRKRKLEILKFINPDINSNNLLGSPQNHINLREPHYRRNLLCLPLHLCWIRERGRGGRGEGRRVGRGGGEYHYNTHTPSPLHPPPPAPPSPPRLAQPLIISECECINLDQWFFYLELKWEKGKSILTCFIYSLRV